MSPIHLIGVAVIFIFIVLLGNTRHPMQKKHNVLSSNTSKEKEAVSPTPPPTIIPTDTQIPPTLHPTMLFATTTPIPTATNSPQQNTSSFQYPNATQVNANGDTTYYESHDSPSMITDWYKAKIRSMGMNTTSFVQNNTNDNVLNQLVGSDGKRNIRVEITKPNGKTTVKITVTISGS